MMKDDASETVIAKPGLAFEPDGARARLLDQRMRADLAASIRYIFGQANGQLAVSSQRLEHFLERLQAGRVSPLTFSFYSDAVLAIEDDEIEAATDFFNGLLELPFPPDRTSVTDLADPATSSLAQRFVRFVDTDEKVRFVAYSPSPEESARCRENIRAAFELMDAADPAQAAEIRGLITEICLAAGDKNPKVLTFDGASSFMLWGGIFINAGRDSNPVAMAQMLAHETAHVLMFGLGAEQPLVANEDDELFSSPLRLDPRPMDGIYHATFVTARMHRLVKRLLDSGKLSAADTELARKDLVENARLFQKGIEVVQSHGKLTPVGRELMRGATDYMAANA